MRNGSGRRGAGRPAAVGTVGGVLLLLAALIALLWAPERSPMAESSPGSVRASATASVGSASTGSLSPSPTGSSAPADGRDPESGLRLVALTSLPLEARRTVALIDNNGPFPYTKDGSTFGNREGLLPGQRNGFYREYTVPTPGERDRGARRIVTGDGDRQLFYTADHYASFVRVRR